jgi:PHD/YefM family antitoxin component YafN of YafNO toxin-antitoxin module
MGVAIMKPVITVDQIIRSSDAAKKFGSLRKNAKNKPQYISDNGIIDSVLLSYDYFEKMYERLAELEQKEEGDILSQRIDRLNQYPESGVSWRDIRRSGK